MKNYSFRLLAFLLGVFFLLSSILSGFQTYPGNELTGYNAEFHKHGVSSVNANSQLTFEEKEEKKETRAQYSTFFLLYGEFDVHHFLSMSRHYTFQCSATGVTSTVALYLLVRKILL